MFFRTLYHLWEANVLAAYSSQILMSYFLCYVWNLRRALLQFHVLNRNLLKMTRFYKYLYPKKSRFTNTIQNTIFSTKPLQLSAGHQKNVIHNISQQIVFITVFSVIGWVECGTYFTSKLPEGKGANHFRVGRFKYSAFFHYFLHFGTQVTVQPLNQFCLL